jgi:Outer membrane lipoprotein carrier protein LolA-like
MISGTDRGQRSSVLIWLLAALVTTAGGAELQATADDALAEPWGVNQLMSELGRVQHAKARFVERKYLKVLKTPLETTGTLEYDAPDRLVKRTLEPKPETMTVAGERLVIESQARSRTLRLGDYPVLGAFVESLRATLNGDLAALERFYRVTLEGGPQRWQLTLTPRDPKMSALIESILIAGGRGRVGRVEVRETQGDRSVMTVLEDAP